MQRRIEKPVKYLRWNFSRNFLTTSKYSDIWQGFEYDSGKWDFVWSLYTYTQKCTDVMNIWGCNDYEDVLILAYCYYVKSFPMRSFFWSLLSRIWNQYKDLRSKSKYRKPKFNVNMEKCRPENTLYLDNFHLVVCSVFKRPDSCQINSVFFFFLHWIG